jgi:hypothetical protein
MDHPIFRIYSGAQMKSDLMLLFLPVLGFAIILGLIAVINPDLFRRLATSGSRWVDTNKFVAKLDTPVNIDCKVLSHARLFGLAVVLSSLFLAYLLYQRLSGGPFGF